MLALSILLLVQQFETPPPLPLPELDDFLLKTKANLLDQYDEAKLLKGYTYRLKTTREGKRAEITEHDVFNLDKGRYLKLVSKNGIAAAPKDPKKDDGPPFSPNSRKGKEDYINDLFNVYEFRMVRREVINDRPAIVIEFTPIKDSKPKTWAGKSFLKKSAGRVWVDEDEHRVVRMKLRVIDDITLGLGFLVRVKKGTEITREWRKVNDEIWLPSRAEKQLEARIFMAKGINFHEVEEYLKSGSRPSHLEPPFRQPRDLRREL